jgi:hypothetical protein
LTATFKRAAVSDDPHADLLLASHTGHDVNVREGEAGNHRPGDIRGRARRRTAEDAMQLLRGKAALGHRDLVRADPEAKFLLEEDRHRSRDFRSRDFRSSQNVNPKPLLVVEDDASGSDGPRRFQERLGLLPEYPPRSCCSSWLNQLC